MTREEAWCGAYNAALLALANQDGLWVTDAHRRAEDARGCALNADAALVEWSKRFGLAADGSCPACKHDGSDGKAHLPTCPRVTGVWP